MDEVGPDDETQDMSGVGESEATNIPSPAVSSTGSSSITLIFGQILILKRYLVTRSHLTANQGSISRVS